jgi:hypothetical protein
MRPLSIDERMRVRLAALLGIAPVLCEGVRRLAQTFRAYAVLAPGLRHRQAVGFGGTPAFGGEAAVKMGAATGAGNPARRGCHADSLRAVESQRKFVIKAKANPCMPRP